MKRKRDKAAKDSAARTNRAEPGPEPPFEPWEDNERGGHLFWTILIGVAVLFAALAAIVALG